MYTFILSHSTGPFVSSRFETIDAVIFLSFRNKPTLLSDMYKSETLILRFWIKCAAETNKVRNLQHINIPLSADPLYKILSSINGLYFSVVSLLLCLRTRNGVDFTWAYKERYFVYILKGQNTICQELKISLFISKIYNF